MGAAAGEGVPHYSCDFYGDAFIQDPWPHYSAMRALGPVVFIPDLGNYALTQYAAVRAALRSLRSLKANTALQATLSGARCCRAIPSRLNRRGILI